VNIAVIDTSATSGTSWLHRISPKTKLVAFALVLAAVVTTWNLFIAATLIVMLAAGVFSAHLKARLAFGLAAYPGLFALIFALASAPDLLTGAVIVLKAVTAALGAVIVVLTTPYPQIFAPVQRIVPGVVGDSLLMTYRAMFLLLEKFSNLLRAMRLRAGIRGVHPVRSARMTTRALGGLLLYSFDLSQHDYDIMRLRGYEGRMRAELPRSALPGGDAALLTAAALALGTSVLWRIAWQSLNPFSWLPLGGALLVLAVALIARWRTS
jgi:energy-coupling factor transporter transmembrane protein EcfT